MTSVVLSLLAFLTTLAVILYAFQLHHKIRRLESVRHMSGILHTRIEVLKKVTHSLSNIDKVIMSSPLDRHIYKNAIIDKTSCAYFSTKEVFDENHAFLPEQVTVRLVKEKIAIDNLIREVKDNITRERVDKNALDQTLSELLQRENVWVELVEKNFRSQLENCISKVNSILN